MPAHTGAQTASRLAHCYKFTRPRVVGFDLALDDQWIAARNSLLMVAGARLSPTSDRSVIEQATAVEERSRHAKSIRRVVLQARQRIVADRGIPGLEKMLLRISTRRAGARVMLRLA